MRLCNRVKLTVSILFLFHISCSKGDEGIRKNPFEEDGSAVQISIASRSNADTLFVSWEVGDIDSRYDHFRLELSKPGKAITLSKGETSTFFTRLPYNEPVQVILTLM